MKIKKLAESLPASKVRSMVTKPGFEGKTSVKDPQDKFIDYDAVWADKHRGEIMKKWNEKFRTNSPLAPAWLT